MRYAVTVAIVLFFAAPAIAQLPPPPPYEFWQNLRVDDSPYSELNGRTFNYSFGWDTTTTPQTRKYHLWQAPIGPGIFRTGKIEWEDVPTPQMASGYVQAGPQGSQFPTLEKIVTFSGFYDTDGLFYPTSVSPPGTIITVVPEPCAAMLLLGVLLFRRRTTIC